jgi:hypothetical protein
MYNFKENSDKLVEKIIIMNTLIIKIFIFKTIDEVK